ncbi:hypothetical protein [Natrinema marinum]|uniref:hypothetical protein n=1 Tax=Natrinema marinum TaxID=2961598 RepID=UPI0020C86240|nr:hypothetical protein [Natrinema marinum]
MSDDDATSARSRLSVTRREALAAVGGAALAAPTGTTASAVAADRRDPVLVRVCPGAVPLQARLRYGPDALRGDWPRPLRDALAAVESAFEQVLTYAGERERLADLEVRVEPGPSIRFPPAEMPLSADAVVPSTETLLGRFRDRLRERNALTDRSCHLLLHWSPLNYRVGYGGTVSPNALTGAADGGDAQTVANVGATEVWDSRAVTRNIAIHETLHTFLSSDIVDDLGAAVCDHELGAAVRTAPDTLRISPMATAYAGPDRIGGGTRFHGTGCYDHDRFSRHDGTEGIENWTYTTELSEATLEGVTRYLEDHLER